MAKFAQGTSVAPEKTRMEIERVLSRYGATQFGYATTPEQAAVIFEMNGRRIRFVLPMPARDAPAFVLSHNGRKRRSPAEASAAFDAEVRRRWRALFLTIKAKLEAVESEIVTFEEEFLAHIVMPNGETVGRWLTPQLAAAYESRRMPPMLPGLPAPRGD